MLILIILFNKCLTSDVTPRELYNDDMSYSAKMIFSIFIFFRVTFSGAVGKGYGGDPHFLVSSESEDPICFNYSPATSSDLILIYDPETNLVVSAHTNVHSNGKYFMSQILVKTPEGVTFEIDAEEKPHLKFSGENATIKLERKTGELTLGRLIFKK